MVLRFLLCVLPCVLLCVGVIAYAAAPAGGVELSPCTLTASEGRQEVRARCTTLAVPLNPDDPDAGSLELFVAVVAALAESAAADPLTVIAGGPGDSATRFFAQAEQAFALIRRTRDIILVDQRGSGRSAPLHCEEFQELGPLADVATDVDTLVEITLDCLDELEHDPRFFTTTLAVGDLERVRQALGYAQFNLYGISYGTRVAQHYLRRYPERTRSVILDGVVPPVLALGEDIALASQAALDALFGRCAADGACGNAFPELRASFGTLLERLEQDPVHLTFAHPRSGEPTDVVVDRLALAGVVRLLLYNPVTMSMLPVLIDAAHDGNYEPLVTQAYLAAAGIEDLAMGLNYAIVCTEDAPFFGEIDVAAQAATYLGTAFTEVLGRVCERWPRGPIDADFKEVVSSDVPVLFLSGERDPITPPRYVDFAAEGLTHYAELLGPGQGHGMLASGCVPRIMAAFVDSPDTADLDLDCAERMRPFPLLTSPLGPAP